FHQNAKPAAEAAQGVFAMAGSDGFWKFHDTAFKNQQALSADSYVKWAQDAGVKDVAKYKAGLDAHTWADKVDKDHAEATWGGDKAIVTMIEFSDFQCPFCKRVEDSLKKVHDQYGDKVRLVWKNEPLPFHPRAEPAAEVAMEGKAEKGDKGFWAAHAALFDTQ